MSYATSKQVSYIDALVKRAGFESAIAAVDAYGLGLRPPRELTGRQASEMITWLKQKTDPAYAEASASSDRRATAFDKYMAALKAAPTPEEHARIAAAGVQAYE